MQVTKEVNEVIVGAIEYARENKHEYVTAEHILYKCTFIEKVQNAMEKCGADIENLRKNLNEYFNEYIKTTDSAGIQESYSFQQVILIAGEQCIASGKNVIEIEHILSVIYMMEDSYALYFLNSFTFNSCSFAVTYPNIFCSKLTYYFYSWIPRIVSCIRFFFISTLITFTSTISPTLTASSGCLMNLSVICEICTSPS